MISKNLLISSQILILCWTTCRHNINRSEQTNKESAQRYVCYLKKTPIERIAFSVDDSDSWILLADSGYTGPESDVPGLRKEVIPKHDNITTLLSNEGFKNYLK